MVVGKHMQFVYGASVRTLFVHSQGWFLRTGWWSANTDFPRPMCAALEVETSCCCIFCQVICPFIGPLASANMLTLVSDGPCIKVPAPSHRRSERCGKPRDSNDTWKWVI
jgi:hypothetical protein